MGVPKTHSEIHETALSTSLRTHLTPHSEGVFPLTNHQLVLAGVLSYDTRKI